MKKIALSLFLLLASTFFVVYANEPAAGCPTCEAPACSPDGICVPYYGEDGKISYYLCADPSGSSATKDCKRNPGGGE